MTKSEVREMFSRHFIRHTQIRRLTMVTDRIRGLNTEAVPLPRTCALGNISSAR